MEGVGHVHLHHQKVVMIDGQFFLKPYVSACGIQGVINGYMFHWIHVKQL